MHRRAERLEVGDVGLHLRPGLVALGQRLLLGVGDRHHLLDDIGGHPLVRHPVDRRIGHLGRRHALVRGVRHGAVGVEGIDLADLGELAVLVGQHDDVAGLRQLGHRRGRGRGLAEGVDLAVAQRTAGIGEGHHRRLDLVEQVEGAQDVGAVEHRARSRRAERHFLALQVRQRLDAAVAQGHEVGRALVGHGDAAQHGALVAAFEGAALLQRHIDVGAVDDAHVELALDEALGVLRGAAGGHLGDVDVRQFLADLGAGDADHVVHDAAGVGTAPGDVGLCVGRAGRCGQQRGGEK